MQFSWRRRKNSPHGRQLRRSTTSTPSSIWPGWQMNRTLKISARPISALYWILLSGTFLSEACSLKCLVNEFFSAYRFVTRLEEILIESGFSDGAPIPDELNSLVVVMLWELAERRFLLRGTRSKSALGTRVEEVQEVEKHLDKWAVKLAASLARLRIRESR